ncbi:hypothetical protein VDGL01_10516 [Verticillium dahliae]
MDKLQIVVNVQTIVMHYVTRMGSIVFRNPSFVFLLAAPSRPSALLRGPAFAATILGREPELQFYGVIDPEPTPAAHLIHHHGCVGPTARRHNQSAETD